MRRQAAVDPADQFVAPEDVGKLPDQNVAESLQRLPGVQIDRGEGRGTTVLIDGLRQNLTTLNGDIPDRQRILGLRRKVGRRRRRQHQDNSLEGIPIEEIRGIDVDKNPKASITEGGLGGTSTSRRVIPWPGPMASLRRQCAGHHRSSAEQLDAKRHPRRLLQVQRPPRRHRHPLL